MGSCVCGSVLKFSNGGMGVLAELDSLPESHVISSSIVVLGNVVANFLLSAIHALLGRSWGPSWSNLSWSPSKGLLARCDSSAETEKLWSNRFESLPGV
jgi:hypothetical protein